MSDERGELAKVIFDSNRSNTQIDLQDDRRLKGSQLAWAGYAADAILAAGYRKPQQVTTVEELDAAISAAFEDARALVVSDRSARPWIIWEDEDGDAWVESWPQEEDPERLTVSGINLPATVLHVGGAE